MRELNLFIGLSRTYLYIMRETEQILREHDLTKGQFSVMEALYHKGEMTATALRAKILATPGNLPVIIRNLVRDGYIDKRTDPRDKRSSLLTLTDSGRDKIEAVMPENERRIKRIIGVWDKAEQKEMLRLLKKFRREYYG